MEIRKFKEILFEKAKQSNFSKYEIYYTENESLKILSYENAVDGYELKDSRGLSFRALVNGKMGYGYTENLSEDSVDMLIDTVKQSAEFVCSDDEEFIYAGGANYSNVQCSHPSLENLTAEEQIKLVLELEKKTKEHSPEVFKIAECSMEVSNSEVRIMNSEGLDLESKRNIGFSYVVPIVKDGEDMKDCLSIVVSNKLQEFNINEMAKVGVEGALKKRGAKPVKSGKYKILLSNYMMATLLSTFQSSFNGDKAQKGLSLLKGKEGKLIAAPIVNIIDNPLMENGPYSTPFDAEGVPTKIKHIVEAGVFKTLLYNLKTANKEGIETTGNASKSSFSSAVEVSATNLYIEKGEKTFEELAELVQDGLYITDLEGTHSGANPVTGDFSLAAGGAVIRHGKVCEAVNQITVSGNFYELLKNIEAVGSDFKFYYSNTASPSVIITELSIAGE